MKAIILSCGTEIVTGQCIDTNSAWLSQRLTAHGVEIVSHVSVGDDPIRIATAVREARTSADLVIITGGLGPTKDDLTREALAIAIDQPLEENREALQQIELFFRQAQREMPESNRVQALIPRGCEVIVNPRGTAPGIAHWESSNAENTRGHASQSTKSRDAVGIVALPGVPGEMKNMFIASIEPRLHAGASRCTRTARLQCYGISEATLGEMIADMMVRDRNPLVGTTASGAVLSIRILATADSPDSATRLIDADRAELRRRAGSAIFGEDGESLQSSVVQLLTGRGETVATAESCTGGMLAQMLTDVPGSSAVFPQGVIVYSNMAKSALLDISQELIEGRGAVSEEVARKLAENMRVQAGTTYALSTTGIAGPDGGSASKPVGLVFIGLADMGGVEVRRILLGQHLTRDEIRDRASKNALNLLRLKLLSAP